MCIRDRSGIRVSFFIDPDPRQVELAKKLNRLWPGVKCLFMSGYTTEAATRKGLEAAGTHFIRKPFRLTELARKVRDVLDA